MKRPSPKLAAAGLLLATTLAHASPPTMVQYLYDRTVRMPSYSAVCGFPVYRHFHSLVDIKLFTSGDGSQVVREIDTTPGGKTTYFSPVALGGTGGSFDVPFGGHDHYLYPDGVYLGAPALEIMLGNYTMSAPGFPSSGQVTWQGEIVDIDENGVPFAEFYYYLEPEVHGHHTLSPAAPKICEMLQR